MSESNHTQQESVDPTQQQLVDPTQQQLEDPTQQQREDPTQQQREELVDLSRFPDYTGPQIKYLKHPSYSSNGRNRYNDEIWVDGECVKFCVDEEHPSFGYSRRIIYIIFDPVTKMLSIFTRTYSLVLIIINVETGRIVFYHHIGEAFDAVPVKIPQVTAYFHRDRFFLVPHHENHCLTPCKTLDKFTTRDGPTHTSKPKGDLILSEFTPPPNEYLDPNFSTWTNYGTRTLAGVEETFTVDGDTIVTRTLVGVRTRKYTSILAIDKYKYECNVLVGLHPPHAKNFTMSPCGHFLIWCEVNAVMIHYVNADFTAPLFTVGGKGKVEINNLTFSEDGREVVAVLEDGTEEKSDPLF